MKVFIIIFLLLTLSSQAQSEINSKSNHTSKSKKSETHFSKTNYLNKEFEIIEEENFLPLQEGIGGERGLFGSSVDRYENTLVIGALGTLEHGVAYIYELIGGEWQYKQTLMPKNKINGASFGHLVDIIENRIVITDPASEFSQEYNYGPLGAIHVFEKQNDVWVESQKIQPESYTTTFHFGISIVQNEEQIIVGAPRDYTSGVSSGAVYVFEKENGVWRQQQMLFNPTGKRGDFFGRSLGVFDNNLLIGASRDDTLGEDVGAVYSYEYSGSEWVQNGVVFSTIPKINERFGYTIKVDDNFAVIGTQYEERDSSGRLNSKGAAHVFNHDGQSWKPIQVLTSDIQAQYNTFGSYLDINEGLLAVASPENFDGEEYFGAILFFQYDGYSWVKLNDLRSNYVIPNGFKAFGRSITLAESNAYVGSYGHAENALLSGSVFEYSINGLSWEQEQTFFDTGAAKDLFGSDVSLSNSHILIGAIGDDAKGKNSGAVYAYFKEVNDWKLLDILYPKIGYRTAPVGEISFNNLEFGKAVEVHENLAAISAPFMNILYLYQFSEGQWKNKYEINYLGNYELRNFGKAISLGNNRIAISADVPIENNLIGVVLILDFIEGTWYETDLIYSPTTEHNTFGNDIDLAGDSLLIGMPGYGQGSNHKGAAFLYTYENSQWTLNKEFGPEAFNRGYLYGYAVAQNDNEVMIGTPNEFEFSVGDQNGAVYVYNKIEGSWVQTQKIKIPLYETGGGFGGEISLSDRYLAIGGSKPNLSLSSGIGEGAVYLFSKNANEWVLQKNLKPENNSSAFGSVISLHDDYLLAASINDYRHGLEAGSAVLFNLKDEYFVSGHVIGLMEGNVIQISLNNSEVIQLNQIGRFNFETILKNNETYSVKIDYLKFQQDCIVKNSYGTINHEDVTNVVVSCSGVQKINELN